MHRSSTLAPILAAVALLTLVPAVLAGGWATVAMVDPPQQPVAGETTTLQFDVRQHGETPVSWPELTVLVTGPDGDVVAERADPVPGDTGRYAVDVVLPAGGDWTVSFASTDLVMDGSAALHVAAGAPAPAPLPISPATAADEGLARLLIAAVIVGLAAAFAAVLIRHRRPVATIPGMSDRSPAAE
jgi:hypothetical protein